MNRISQALFGFDVIAPKATQDAQSLAQGLKDFSLLVQPARGEQMSQRDMTAHHGTPHVFPPESGFKHGRFRLDKIGTGEGAQSYGHGLYWAETPEVAATYRNPGGPRSGTTPITIDGIEAGRYSQKQGIDLVEARAADAIGRTRNPDFAIEYLAQDASHDKTAAKAIDWIKNNKKRLSDPGNLYEASLRWPDAAREAKDPLSAKHFLDWDKPLSQQNESVQKALRPIVRDAIAKQGTPAHLVDYYTDSKQGEDILKEVLYRRGGKVGASEELNALGIPGITYLDQGSRVTGDGTRNFVTVNDAIVELLKRNGMGLLGK
jgi:hypothetical protein